MATYEMTKRYINREIANGKIQNTWELWKKKLDRFLCCDRLTPEQHEELDELINQAVPEARTAQTETI